MKKLVLSTAAIAALSLAWFGPAQAQAYRTSPGYYTDPVTGAATAGAGIVGGAANFGTDIFGGALSASEGLVGGILSPFGAPFGNNYSYGGGTMVPAGFTGQGCRPGRAYVNGAWQRAVICNN